MFLVSDAYAQTTTGTAAPGGILAQLFGGPLSPVLMMGLMFGILYLMVIRPQNNERKKLEDAIGKLKKGDKVLTTSGIVATVVTIEPERAVLLIAEGVKVEFTRAAIAQVLAEGK
jgi:preprotein translocase subunit YajC